MKITCSKENLTDWHERAKHTTTMTPMPDFGRILEQRKEFFRTLRAFLCDIERCENNEDIQAVFKKYDVHFVNVDEIERVEFKTNNTEK